MTTLSSPVKETGENVTVLNCAKPIKDASNRMFIKNIFLSTFVPAGSFSIGVLELPLVESRKVFHPCVLTEPCVKVSLHTALPVYKSQMYCYIMDAPTASVGINGVVPYTFVSAI